MNKVELFKKKYELQSLVEYCNSLIEVFKDYKNELIENDENEIISNVNEGIEIFNKEYNKFIINNIVGIFTEKDLDSNIFNMIIAKNKLEDYVPWLLYKLEYEINKKGETNYEKN